MASIIEGYEYDIFISYRQNDNKYDRWVSEFVMNLNKELEATIKNKITVYIDENSSDGLLETHDIDKSLSNKLKSLIFVPVLSHTYCDPNSYAWQREFLAFNKMSKEDQFSKDIILRNGNVTHRILPIRIHDLDADDLTLLHEELGGPLRAIDFVYKEPGVNRPLRPEDNEDKNLNKTRYRNQVNKVANSVKEILISIQNHGKPVPQSSDDIIANVAPSRKSIAVLPFLNMSNDPEQEYFSDGISEEIINTLVQIQDLKVAGRTSAFSFKNKNEDLRIIGEKLNVNTILEGSVRKSGNRIRVSVQLIEASTGFHLWSQTFDRELNDVFIVQDEIAKAVVDKLKITLGGKPVQPKERRHSSNVEAYQLYLKGRSLYYKRGVHMVDGLKCFEEALKIDPDYALALSGLADSYSMLCAHSYLSPEECWPKAAEAANHASLIEPELAEVHSSIATIAFHFERNWARAEKEFQIALKLNPRYVQARCWYSLWNLQIFKHDHKSALKNALICVKNDPLSSYPQTILSTITSNAGMHNEAIAAGEKSVEIDPDSFAAWYWLGYSNHFAGNLQSAIKAYRKALDISGRHNWAITSLLSLLSDSADNKLAEEANSLFNELTTKAKIGYVAPSLLATASAAIGKNEDAIRYARQAVDRHDPLLGITTQPRSDNTALRALPEFREIIKAIGLQ